MSPVRWLVIAGSARAESHNLKLARELLSFVPDGIECSLLLPADVSLPLYNQDLEVDADVMLEVRRLHALVAAADALIVVSPEHNGSVCAYLKNLLDWVSRLAHIGDRNQPSAFSYKPILLACATSSWHGGSLGLLAVRNVLSYLGAVVLPDQLQLNGAAEAWDEDGKLLDMSLLDKIPDALGRLVQQCQLQGARP
jgi:chromate reductase